MLNIKWDKLISFLIKTRPVLLYALCFMLSVCRSHSMDSLLLSKKNMWHKQTRLKKNWGEGIIKIFTIIFNNKQKTSNNEVKKYTVKVCKYVAKFTFSWKICLKRCPKKIWAPFNEGSALSSVRPYVNMALGIDHCSGH